MSEPYNSDELQEIRTQAVWYPTETLCPRHHTPMKVVRTRVFQVEKKDAGTSVLFRFCPGWATIPGWDRDLVELRCDDCGLGSVEAKTGSAPNLVWAGMLGTVREAIQKRGRDPRIVVADQRELKVTIPTTGNDKFAISLLWQHLNWEPWDDLHAASDGLARFVLDQYDQDAKRK